MSRGMSIEVPASRPGLFLLPITLVLVAISYYFGPSLPDNIKSYILGLISSYVPAVLLAASSNPVKRRQNAQFDKELKQAGKQPISK